MNDFETDSVVHVRAAMTVAGQLAKVYQQVVIGCAERLVPGCYAVYIHWTLEGREMQTDAYFRHDAPADGGEPTYATIRDVCPEMMRIFDILRRIIFGDDSPPLVRMSMTIKAPGRVVDVLIYDERDAYEPGVN